MSAALRGSTLSAPCGAYMPVFASYSDERSLLRHAYSTGPARPYEKLKRARRTEISEVAWATLSSTTSHPFAPPETGKIAMKVINHYGDEVLKAYHVGR